MYYDVQVRLTQGWYTYAYDLSYHVAVDSAELLRRCNYLDVRLVPHIATV